jgi:hypothetical protein
MRENQKLRNENANLRQMAQALRQQLNSTSHGQTQTPPPDERFYFNGDQVYVSPVSANEMQPTSNDDRGGRR